MAAFALVTTSATKVYSPGHAGTASASGFLPGGREKVTIFNHGPNPIFWDYASTVTTDTGQMIPAASGEEIQYSARPIWAIAITANQSSPLDTRVTVDLVLI